MAHELGKDGTPYCKRLGAACDFKVEGENTREVLRWIVDQALPFDRAYYFGPNRALHISYGPEHSRYICAFNQSNVPEQKSVADLVQLAEERYES